MCLALSCPPPPLSVSLNILLFSFHRRGNRYAPLLRGQAVCWGADKQKSGDSQTEGWDVRQKAAQTSRQSGGQTVGTADRLAVGFSLLTRPDSFHAGSCDSEREDWVRFRLFDVGVALAFEGTAHFACVCFFKPCCVRLTELPGPGAGRPFQ